MPRTVFSNRELPHIWAYQTQPTGRAGNMFFAGETIYSYGHHFPIARHVVHGKRHCVFFTTRNYSATTSGHKSRARQAIPGAIRVFYVDDVTLSPLEQIKRLRKGIEELKEGVAGAKNRTSRGKRAGELISAVQSANEFCEFFGYKTRFAVPDLADLESLASEWKQEAADRLAAHQRKQQAECRRQERARLEADAEARADLEAWRDHRGRHSSRFYSLPVALRINRDSQEIETSHGVSFPVDHAKRSAPFVASLLESGQEFHANGRTIHLGHYQIDSIDAEGTIHAGCHHVSKDEAVRLLAELASV